MNRSTRNLLAVPLLSVSCGLAIVATYTLLKSRIETAQRQAAEAIYFDALQLQSGAAQLDSPRMTDDAALLGLRAPRHIYIARQNDHIVGIVLPLTAREGYVSDIDLLLGVDANGQVISVRVMSHHETSNLGDKIEPEKSNWIDQFRGTTFDDAQKHQWQLRSEGGAFDGITGATVTSRAVIKSVQQGLEYFAAHRNELLEENRHE